MKSIFLRSLALLFGMLAASMMIAPAQAQATRTYVSGVGDDANPCSRTAPCRTFAGTISKTTPSGEINCIDPGNFGAVTITKSITIDCLTTEAAVTSTGSVGITINAANTDVVELRGLSFNGVVTGTNAIKLQSAGAVSIEKCQIVGFLGAGITDQRAAGTPYLSVKDATIYNNGGPGVVAVASVANAVVLDNVRSENNTYGVAAATGNNVVIKNSIFARNSVAGVEGDGGSQITVDRSTIAHNGFGIQSASTVRVSNSDIAFNTTATSGNTGSFGNNRLSSNGSAGSGLTPLGGASTDVAQQ